jgi:L-aminopeptidase/D-esterase-like protein
MDVRPDGKMAYAACENASYDSPALGNVGAGTGCTVGKICGPARAMKSGFGTFAVQAGSVKVGALVAVNALGDVYENGAPVAGLRTPDGSGLDNTLEELFRQADQVKDVFTGNTTLGIIVTNVQLPKSQLAKIAGMAHNGYARAIRPVHTTADGDSIYALSTGRAAGDVNLVGAMAAHAMERAIVRAAKAARTAYGFQGYLD